MMNPTMDNYWLNYMQNSGEPTEQQRQNWASQYNNAGRPASHVNNPVATAYNPKAHPYNYTQNLNPNAPQNNYNPFTLHGLKTGIHQQSRDQGRQTLGADYSDKNYDALLQKGLQNNPFNQAAKDNGISLQQSQANALRNSGGTIDG